MWRNAVLGRYDVCWVQLNYSYLSEIKDHKCFINHYNTTWVYTSRGGVMLGLGKLVCGQG